MKTVKLNEIVRQRDPELKQVVEQLARGEVGEAIGGLERQGRVHEVKDPAARIVAIAKEYAKSPENTLVVSPDNRSRAEINQAIHSELQGWGVVGREEYRIHALIPARTSPEPIAPGLRGISSTTCCSTRARRKRPALRRVRKRGFTAGKIRNSLVGAFTFIPLLSETTPRPKAVAERSLLHLSVPGGFRVVPAVRSI
jgi:hypothetical protein